MRLRLRLLITLIRALFFGKRIHTSDVSVIKIRVWFNDVDISQVTNDRYVAFMDLGRMDFAVRVGLLRTMIRKGWDPRARLATIRNRHPLKLLQRFELHTSLVHWDESWFWFKQEFVFNGRTTSIAYSKVGLANGKGMIKTQRILTTIGMPGPSPAWHKADAMTEIEEDLRSMQR